MYAYANAKKRGSFLFLFLKSLREWEAETEKSAGFHE